MSSSTVNALVKRGLSKKLAERVAAQYTLTELKKLSDKELKKQFGKDAEKIAKIFGRKLEKEEKIGRAHV